MRGDGRARITQQREGHPDAIPAIEGRDRERLVALYVEHGHDCSRRCTIGWRLFSVGSIIELPAGGPLHIGNPVTRHLGGAAAFPCAFVVVSVQPEQRKEELLEAGLVAQKYPAAAAT